MSDSSSSRAGQVVEEQRDIQSMRSWPVASVTLKSRPPTCARNWGLSFDAERSFESSNGYMRHPAYFDFAIPPQSANSSSPFRWRSSNPPTNSFRSKPRSSALSKAVRCDMLHRWEGNCPHLHTGPLQNCPSCMTHDRIACVLILVRLSIVGHKYIIFRCLHASR